MDLKGEIIESGDVEEGVYAQAIRQFDWPEHVDGPKFHTTIQGLVFLGLRRRIIDHGSNILKILTLIM